MSDDHNGDNSGHYELLMPFVSVKSNGGPHDDDSFCAGYQMGLLDAELAGSVFDQGRAIAAANREQADLIAMRHGFVAEFTKAEDIMCGEHAAEWAGWVCMYIRRPVDPDQPATRQ